MKRLLLTSLCTLGATLATSAFATEITGFGTNDFAYIDSLNTDYYINGSDSFTVSATNDFELYASLDGNTSFDASSTLYLTALIESSSTLSGTFTITLYDADYDGATYTGDWADFVSGTLSTASLTLSGYDYSGDGSIGSYTTLVMSTAGDGATTLTITLDSLTNTLAVPEPSSYALFAGMASLGWVGLRRRRFRRVD